VSILIISGERAAPFYMITLLLLVSQSALSATAGGIYVVPSISNLHIIFFLWPPHRDLAGSFPPANRKDLFLRQRFLPEIPGIFKLNSGKSFFPPSVFSPCPLFHLPMIFFLPLPFLLFLFLYCQRRQTFSACFVPSPLFRLNSLCPF